MEAAPDPKEVFRSTSGKANFQRLARLLMSGGTTVLREVFDQFCPPSNLPIILRNPATEGKLRAARLTRPEWNCLYPSPGVVGRSAEFSFILLFRLMSTICNLTPPITGWHALPGRTDHSLSADLARIKYYRNSVYGHPNQNMEITDDEFSLLWQEISTALVRIAGHLSQTRKHEWQKAIDTFLEETEVQERIESSETVVQNEAKDIKSQLEEEQQTTVLKMEPLKTSKLQFYCIYFGDFLK